MPADPERATGKTRPSQTPHRLGTDRIRRDFAKILSRNPKAVIDSTRDSSGHVVLNADDLFKRWPEYKNTPRSRRWLGSVLYAEARAFIDHAFARLLAAKSKTGQTVVFTAGGGASGKSTILRAQAERPDVDFVVDTTFSNTDRALLQIDTALQAGRLVEINYVYRDFRDAVRSMIERALDPKVGRIVPVDDMARTHFGAQETVFTVLERYAEEPRVAILLWKSLPGNKVQRLSLQSLIGLRLPPVDKLEKLGQRTLDECFKEADQDPTGQWESLSGDGSFYEAARSRVQKGVAHPGSLHQQGNTGSRHTSKIERSPAPGNPSRQLRIHPKGPENTPSADRHR